VNSSSSTHNLWDVKCGPNGLFDLLHPLLTHSDARRVQIMNEGVSSALISPHKQLD